MFQHAVSDEGNQVQVVNTNRPSTNIYSSMNHSTTNKNNNNNENNKVTISLYCNQKYKSVPQKCMKQFLTMKHWLQNKNWSKSAEHNP